MDTPDRKEGVNQHRGSDLMSRLSRFALVSRLQHWKRLGGMEFASRVWFRLRCALSPDPQLVRYLEWIRRTEPEPESWMSPPSGLYRLAGSHLCCQQENIDLPVWTGVYPLPEDLQYLVVFRGGIFNSRTFPWVLRQLDEHRPSLLYGDYDHLDGTGERRDPCFLPEWDPEFLKASDYLGPVFFLRRDVLAQVAVASLPNTASTHALLLQVMPALGAKDVWRCARIISHRTEEEPDNTCDVVSGEESPGAARRPLEDQRRLDVRQADTTPKISIVIPTRDHADLLQSCLQSLDSTLDQELIQLILVDNGTKEPGALEILEARRRKGAVVVLMDQPFNFSALVNAGVAAADGELVCLLNNDVRALHAGWLDTLSRLAMRPDVGVVGPLLRYPDGRVQHAGIVLDSTGPRHVAGRRPTMPAIGSVRQFSAVTGACMVLRRELFVRVGGFDERLSVAFNDVDFCLRLRGEGLSIICTPDAVLEHLESASRGDDVEWRNHDRAIRELDRVRHRWQSSFINDPFYNPNCRADSSFTAISTATSLFHR